MSRRNFFRRNTITIPQLLNSGIFSILMRRMDVRMDRYGSKQWGESRSYENIQMGYEFIWMCQYIIVTNCHESVLDLCIRPCSVKAPSQTCLLLPGLFCLCCSPCDLVPFCTIPTWTHFSLSPSYTVLCSLIIFYKSLTMALLTPLFYHRNF